MTEPSDPSDARRGSNRKREPVTLDLSATEVGTPREAPREESSLVDDPRTPEDPPETASAVQASMPDDPRADPAPEPTPSDIEAAVERLIPEGEGRGTEPDIAPAQDVGEAAPSEPAPGPDALDAASAMPAGAAADRIDGRAPDEPAAALAMAPEPRRRAALGPLLAAAVLGGLVGAGLTAVAERYWLNKPADRVRARVGQIEERLAATPRIDLGPLEQRLSGLESRQRETAQQAQAAQAAAETARAAAEQAPNRPVEAGPAQLAAGPDPAVLERIEARIAALEERARGQAEAASQGARLIEERVAEQARQVAALEPRLAGQDRRLGEVAARSSEQGQRLAALSEQLGQQGQQLEGAVKKFAERGPEATAALRVVAADRVIDALRDGAPFPEAFAALNRLGTDPQRLAAVEGFARSGAPTAGALAQEFKPVAQKILSEARGPAESWSDRLSRMAEGIVTVRPVGEAGSATVPGLVARIEDALARGALADAAAAWDALPEGARRGAEAFGRKLKSRAAAEDAARAISNQALAALDAATR